jgi:hypothetical protein
MCVKEDKHLSPDMKGFEVRCLGTFYEEGTRYLSLPPARWGPAWCGPFGAWPP